MSGRGGGNLGFGFWSFPWNTDLWRKWSSAVRRGRDLSGGDWWAMQGHGSGEFLI